MSYSFFLQLSNLDLNLLENLENFFQQKSSVCIMIITLFACIIVFARSIVLRCYNYQQQ